MFSTLLRHVCLFNANDGASDEADQKLLKDSLANVRKITCQENTPDNEDESPSKSRICTYLYKDVSMTVTMWGDEEWTVASDDESASKDLRASLRANRVAPDHWDLKVGDEYRLGLKMGRTGWMMKNWPWFSATPKVYENPSFVPAVATATPKQDEKKKQNKKKRSREEDKEEEEEEKEATKKLKTSKEDSGAKKKKKNEKEKKRGKSKTKESPTQWVWAWELNGWENELWFFAYRYNDTTKVAVDKLAKRLEAYSDTIVPVRRAEQRKQYVEDLKRPTMYGVNLSRYAGSVTTRTDLSLFGIMVESPLSTAEVKAWAAEGATGYFDCVQVSKIDDKTANEFCETLCKKTSDKKLFKAIYKAGLSDDGGDEQMSDSEEDGDEDMKDAGDSKDATSTKEEQNLRGHALMEAVREFLPKSLQAQAIGLPKVQATLERRFKEACEYFGYAHWQTGQKQILAVVNDLCLETQDEIEEEEKNKGDSNALLVKQLKYCYEDEFKNFKDLDTVARTAQAAVDCAWKAHQDSFEELLQACSQSSKLDEKAMGNRGLELLKDSKRRLPRVDRVTQNIEGALKGLQGVDLKAQAMYLRMFGDRFNEVCADGSDTTAEANLNMAKAFASMVKDSPGMLKVMEEMMMNGKSKNKKKKPAGKTSC
jgi:hypothetical protein